MRLLFFLLILNLNGAFAQDYHQWSEQFGVRASLLGGAAAAGLGDNATVYYNPAAMAFVENSSLSVSVNAYRLRRTSIENALGDGLDVKGSDFSTMPNLIAGILTFKKAKKFRMGYAVINRRNLTNKIDYLHQANYEINTWTPGAEIFAASYNLHHQLNEFWAGFGLSYQLSKNFSIGFAHYGIYRDVKYSNSHKTTVMPADALQTNMTSVSSIVSFNYYNIKGIFKPSIAFSSEKFKFGITGTTPSFNMYGRANVYRDFLISDIILGIDASAIDRANSVKAQHKENGSLAIGVSWKMGNKIWMHFTNETFFGGKKYAIFDPETDPSLYPNTTTDSALAATFGNQNFLALGEHTKWVNNMGIGIEFRLNNKLNVLAGARTDFNYNEDPYYLFAGAMNIEASKWDIYHFSIGMEYLTKKDKKYTVGIEFGHTPTAEIYRVLDFTTPAVNNYLLGESNRGTFVKQYSFKVLMNIELGPGKKT